MSRLRIAVVGAGSWGRNHVPTLASLPEAELTAVCDTDEQRLAQVARQFPAVKATPSLDEALATAQAVVVATPAGSHAAVATAAIERGLSVLVEKPFATDVGQARQMAAKARSVSLPGSA